jgi:omega-amidase
MMSEVARTLQITLVGGSIPERSGGKLYNTCCIFGTDGKLKGKHRKVLLKTFFISQFIYIQFLRTKKVAKGKSSYIFF